MSTFGFLLIAFGLSCLILVSWWPASRILHDADTFYQYMARTAKVNESGNLLLGKLLVTPAVWPFSIHGDYVLYDSDNHPWIIPRSSITHKYLRRAFSAV